MTSFRTVCTVQAWASLGSGVVLLIVPRPILGVFELPADKGTEILARMLGGVLFALGAALVGAREATDRDTRVRVAVGNATCDGSITIQLVAACTTGVLPPIAWALAALFAVNAISWLLTLRTR